LAKNIGVIDRVINDSLQAIQKIERIDLFIHDSDHSAEHEAREFELLGSKLSIQASVLPDNSHATDELGKRSKGSHRKFFWLC
jgi:hypothetical protein